MRICHFFMGNLTGAYLVENEGTSPIFTQRYPPRTRVDIGGS